MPPHTGDLAGAASKALYVAGGLGCAALVVTGSLVWIGRARARAPVAAHGDRLQIGHRSGIHSL
jgi:uncharacterized iron-regulated membrane protein